MNLVIVESPAKAKTINKYLGSNYTVLASYGHIRDLPSKNGSVDPENDFKMIWEVDSFSKKYLKEITDSAKKSTKIILATDPDREGEAIAWHVKEFLKEKKVLKENVFMLLHLLFGLGDNIEQKNLQKFTIICLLSLILKINILKNTNLNLLSLGIQFII